MMSVVLTSVIPVSALVNDWFSFFSLKLTFEIVHGVKDNSGYVEQHLFSSTEKEPPVVSRDSVEKEMSLSHSHCFTNL